MPLFFPVSFHPFAVPVLRSFSFKSPSKRTRVFLYTGFIPVSEKHVSSQRGCMRMRDLNIKITLINN